MNHKNDIKFSELSNLVPVECITNKTTLPVGAVKGNLTYMGRFLVNDAPKHVFACSCGLWMRVVGKASSIKSERGYCCSCGQKDLHNKAVELCREDLMSGYTTPTGSNVSCVNPPIDISIVTLECSTCSLDKELWPLGSIRSCASQLNRGVFPCACTSTVIWTKEQNIVRLKREAEGSNYEYLGLVGKYLHGKTKVKFKNTNTGNIWDHLSIDKIISLGYSDRDSKSNLLSMSRKKDESYYLGLFRERSGYPEGTSFTLNEDKVNFRGHNTYWDILCSRCNVPVTQERSPIYRGAVACSCKTGGGYSSHKKGYFYISTWSSFIKCGITNSLPSIRMKNQESCSGLEGTLCYEWSHEDGSVIQELETQIKATFERGVVSKETFPDGYTETYDYRDLSSIVSYVDNYLGNTN